MNETIAFYEKNAQQFYEQTVGVDMNGLYSPFLHLVPDGGRILDAGCGSGRDSLYFKQHGYRVEAFDASTEMCRLATAHLGQPVHQLTFDEVQWDSHFDGIWACASLLHVSRAFMSAALERLARVLKPNGVFFISLKKRDEEWVQDGRFFNGYNESSFTRLIERQTILKVHSLWTSADVRPGREGEEWLNAVLVRVSTSNMEETTKKLTNPAKLWSRGEVCTRPCPIPRRAGVYAWYFRNLPKAVDAAGCVRMGDLTLLYVGISPKASPTNGKPPSRQTLRSRIRYHYRGNAEGSTLRLTLGCLLADKLGIELRRVGSGKRRTFSQGERLLSDWMAANAFVCWVECDEPWIIEEQLISRLALPLNLDQNARHPFCAVLKAIRKEAAARARELPVVC